MPTIELTAKSVDEAKALAAEKLGVSADQVTVTVLEQVKGLFGKSQVRVKAEAPDAVPAPKAAPAPAPAVAPEPVAEAPAEKPAKPARGRGKKEAKVEEEAAPVAEAAPVEAPAPAKPARGRGKKAEAPAAEETEAPAEGEVVATLEAAEDLAGLAREVIAASGLRSTVDVAGVAGKYANLRLDGPDAAFWVGKHGEVLNALQYLLNLMASRKFDHGVRIALDANEYRLRREASLTALANNVAREVKSRGEEAVLQALPAFERRIIHKALSEIEGIQTYSEGEEPNRRVVIAPLD